jgi:hypothetical protein
MARKKACSGRLSRLIHSLGLRWVHMHACVRACMRACMGCCATPPAGCLPPQSPPALPPTHCWLPPTRRPQHQICRQTRRQGRRHKDELKGHMRSIQHSRQHMTADRASLLNEWLMAGQCLQINSAKSRCRSNKRISSLPCPAGSRCSSTRENLQPGN